MTPCHPPYRMLTPRLELRCYAPADAPALRMSMAANRQHLLPWMAWARAEPRTIDEKIEDLRRFRGKFDLGLDFVYGAFLPGFAQVVGGVGLHPRVGPGGLEIGYWIDHTHQGCGLASEMAMAVTRVGLEVLGVERLEIHCEPENIRSMAIAKRLAYERQPELFQQVPLGGSEEKSFVVWILRSDQLKDSPAANLPLRAYDAAERPMQLRECRGQTSVGELP